jgi:hypothetical protein
MTKMILDPIMFAKLSKLQAPVELCDDSGRVLGYFSPAVDPESYKEVDIPISEQDLLRAEQENESYTTSEVLAYLRDLEKP